MSVNAEKMTQPMTTTIIIDLEMVMVLNDSIRSIAIEISRTIHHPVKINIVPRRVYHGALAGTVEHLSNSWLQRSPAMFRVVFVDYMSCLALASRESTGRLDAYRHRRAG